jgi:hypothetical protein
MHQNLFVVIRLAILAHEPLEFQKVRSGADEHVVGNWLAGSLPVSHEWHTDYKEEL